jgi:hypothetical protein
MISQAGTKLSKSSGNITYKQASASASSLSPLLSPKSVDLFVAGQSAHWFSYPEIYSDLARFLKRGGTYAFFGYSGFRITNHPSCTPLITSFIQGPAPGGIGDDWEQPGRSILDNHFLDIPCAKEEDGWMDWEHVFFAGDHFPSSLIPNPKPVVMKKEALWGELEAYLRTMSALHTYHEKNPEDHAKKADLVVREGIAMYENEKGDIVQRFLGRLQARLKEDGTGVDAKLDIEWPMTLILIRRK